MATKKVTLFSLDPTSYPNAEVEVEVIENTAAQIDEFASPKVEEAIKFATVQAKPAKAGQVVDTRPRVNYQGRVYTFSETTQTISPEKEAAGAMVVKNPDGEEYVIATRGKFDSKYESVDGGYRAVDGVKPFRTATKNVAIQTSWGEEQIVLEGSKLCVADEKDIYSVTNAAFEGTYTTDQAKIEAVLAERANKFGE